MATIKDIARLAGVSTATVSMVLNGKDCITKKTKEKVMAAAKADLLALQEGGVDGIMFSNEFSLPYLTKVEPVTIAAMGRGMGELKPIITVSTACGTPLPPLTWRSL